MSATKPVRIAPSILDADLGRLAEEIATVDNAGAEIIHLDVMDGHFVPNLSIGVPIVAAARKASQAFMDTHLMITDPLKYAESFIRAGSDSITFHYEVADDIPKICRHIRDLGAKVGLALNPATPAEVAFPFLDEVDIILVMTVWPGFGSQAFISACLEKLTKIAARLRDDQWLEVDGGVKTTTARQCADAGADVLVAGSAIFRADDAAAAFKELTRAANEKARSDG
ncbi:MAG: ribulose-phosphate 3-epimerase [Phycisphaerae bacterium]